MTSALSLRRVALACAPLLVLLAACGSSSAASNKVATLTTGDVTGGAATTTTISAKETQDKILAYAACMRQNGVDMKDPTFDANGNMTGGGLGANSGVDRRSTAFQTAQKACGSLIEGVNLFGNRRGNFDPTALQTAFNDFTACLRSNGLPDVKDITFGPRGGNGGPRTGNTGDIAPDGSVPGGGPGFGGPPGSFQPGQNAPGGTGFDPTTRLIDQLGLDATDPTVKKAVDACSAIITKAFSANNGSTTTTAG